MTDPTPRFIAPDDAFDGAPLLRTEFSVDSAHGAVSHAELALSALGAVEASIDGQPVSDDVLTPGWTSYEWRVRYSTTDVTELIPEPGSTGAVGLALGNGWYRGRLGWGDGAPPYGPELAAFAELRITFADGYVQVVATDESWRSGPSATTANSLYDGQTIDARRRIPGWDRPGFADDGWGGVHGVAAPALVPYVGPTAGPVQTLRPIAHWRSPSGALLVDFGQNLVGWVRLRVRGRAGEVITVRHAEVLEHDELGTRPLRAARATDTYVLSGGDDEFAPTLTFHGFRYVEIAGWPGDLDGFDPDALEAVVVSSRLRRIGRFDCSDPLLRQLHENVVWGTRGNFLDVPTDCPQRDERLGWTGDIAVFAPTAAFLFDVGPFLRDWLRDLALEQRHHGGIVPFVVPDILKYLEVPIEHQPMDATAVWSDAAAWVPWAMWAAYADREALAEAYPAMADHVRYTATLVSDTGVWDTGFQFGDWLDPDAPADRPDAAKADRGVVATASLLRSARIAADAARVLDHPADAVEFDGLADRLRESFYRVYVADDRIHSDATTVYSLAIVFGVLRDGDLEWAGRRLDQLVTDSGWRISTGFAGTPFILDALTITGHLDTAYRLLLQTENPSWLYPVTMGATTVWERWDSMLPDGSINPGEMTSFNHYALGAVADWLHRTVGGIAALEPGYSRVLVAPRPGGDLTWARTSVDTRYGRVAVDWSLDGAEMRLTVEIPAGVEAVLDLGDGMTETLGSGRHERCGNRSGVDPMVSVAAGRP